MDGVAVALEKPVDAIENIPSIRRKAEFCHKWTDAVFGLQRMETDHDKRRFLLKRGDRSVDPGGKGRVKGLGSGHERRR